MGKHIDYHALLLKLVRLRSEVEGISTEMTRLQQENEELMALVWTLQIENAELKKVTEGRKKA